MTFYARQKRAGAAERKNWKKNQQENQSRSTERGEGGGGGVMWGEFSEQEERSRKYRNTFE